jgi:superfamily II DNA or RNA helicase
MANFDELITQLHNKYPGKDYNNARGKAFEPICKWFLKKDPYWGQEFRNVWLWNEWPGRWGPDIGIDLVAETHTGDLIAVQAKCWSDTVASQEIDSFISASARPEFTQRLLIATSDITKNSEYKLTNSDKPSPFLLGFSLREASVDWLASMDSTRVPRLPPKTPTGDFGFQQTIIDDVVKGFRQSDRGKVIMACGTGKTLVGLWSAEALGSQRTLVLLPSLSLVAQVSKDWFENASTPFRSLFVCSDETAASDSFVGQTEELGVLVTTAPEDIKNFLLGDGRRVVFSTYQSSPKVAEAQASGTPGFDLVIADEAHHCAGKVDSHFATVLDADSLKATRRLFMTATPRIVTKRIKDRAGEFDLEVASMDVEEDFGPDFHVLTFGEAIAGDLLSDYQVAIVLVSDDPTKKLIDKRTLVELENTGFSADAETLAAMEGLIKAINDYDLTHIITYHNRIAQAAGFSKGLSSLMDVLPEAYKLKRQHWLRPLSGKMSTGERTTILDSFRNLPDDQVGVLSNAKCLNEGVDVRAIDGIAFIQPRRSKIDIVQAVGRALRKSSANKVATITIPLFVEEGEDVATALSSSRFEPVWAVLQALRDHDDILAEELDTLRYELGRHPGIRCRLPDKIVISSPINVSDEFLQALETRIVDTTTSSWEFAFGVLVAYKAKEGHCDIPRKHPIKDGLSLGRWVNTQRTAKNRGKLSAECIQRLETIGFVWSGQEAQWGAAYQQLVAYKAEQGDCDVPVSYQTKDGFSLGTWVSSQRIAQKQEQGKLSLERFQRLEAEGFVWDPQEAQWGAAYQQLVAYKAEQGHCDVPRSYQTKDGLSLGDWVNNQRTFKKRGNLSAERIQRLETIGFVWSGEEARWETGYLQLVAYKAVEGHCNVPHRHQTKDGVHLGTWLNTQRATKKRGKLSDERSDRLEAEGFFWSGEEARWETGYLQLVAYKAVEGHCNVPHRHQTKDGFSLGVWVSQQRQAQKQEQGKLSAERIQRLEAIGFVWDLRKALPK